MNDKKSSGKRVSVFKARVLDKLFPSENTKDEVSSQHAPVASTTSLHKKSGKNTLALADAKVYTVQLPSDGLPEAQSQASCESREGKLSGWSELEGESSTDSQDEDIPPRRRIRKMKRGQRTSEVPSCTKTSDAPRPVATQEGTQTPRLQNEPSSLATDSFSLTKNQRRKLRKKRAKLGRLDDQPSRRATEFTCHVEDQGPGRGAAGGDKEGLEEETMKVAEFMEAVWRVFSCDASKSKTAASLTQPFRKMIDQITNGRLRGQFLDSLREIQKLLVLQDFVRARRKLDEYTEDQQSSTSESESISLVATLAEYWMTEIIAPKCHNHRKTSVDKAGNI